MLQSAEKFSHVRFAGAAGPARSPRWHAPRTSPQLSPRNHPAPPRPEITEEHLLVNDILRRSGVEAAAYRTAALIRRVPACLRSLKVRNPAEALARLAADPQSIEHAANALLIGVTDFFRDPEAYDRLRCGVFADLLAGQAPVRILSAACSDGAELYSLAMCAAEIDALSRCTFIGVDCRSQALKRAREGWYPQTALPAVPLHSRARFIRPDVGGFRVADPIRRATTWHKADICRFVDTAPFHLVACRNVAIYLHPDAAELLWARIATLLVPGGILFAGKAERPRNGFIRIALCIFKKVQT